MVMAAMWNKANSEMLNAISEAGAQATTSLDLIQAFSAAASRKFVSAIATHSSPRPALKVQSRALKVVTKVRIRAVWTLVAANLLFALLGLVVTVIALLAASVEVHQVHLRLDVTGLAAQLFEGSHATKKAKDRVHLFERPDGSNNNINKRVQIEMTPAGGAEYVWTENWEE